MPEDTATWMVAQVIWAVSEIQVQCGLEVGAMDGTVVPLSDGFDSLNCLEASVLLSKRLGVTVEHRVFATSRGVPVSIAQIARTIISQHGAQINRPSELAA